MNIFVEAAMQALFGPTNYINWLQVSEWDRAKREYDERQRHAALDAEYATFTSSEALPDNAPRPEQHL